MITTDSIPEIFKKHMREKPRSYDDVQADRAKSVQKMKDAGLDVPEKFACDHCVFISKCKLAFDAYNTGGDCLINK